MQTRPRFPLIRLIGSPGLITFVLIGLLVLLGMAQIAPPRSVPTSAAPTEFSAERAMASLNVFAQTPRPIGSVANGSAREYLVQQLSSLGMTTEVQTAEVSRTFASGRSSSGTVANVIGRLPGTASSKALLLAAHYDSVTRGPGASDDGAAVAALLETLRALRAGPPLKNDLIILLTDGEERGLLGAKAFVEQHRWAADVGLALNFEARGSTGASFMFETSNQNGWLISEFARAAPYPKGFSFTYDLYQLLPNDTDFTLFNGAGMPGLNFAFVDGYPRYHTPDDTIANLDHKSLQHHGSYALSLARHFGNLDLRNVRAPNAVYFTLLGVGLVHYGQRWIWPLTGLVLLVLLLVAALGLRSRQLTPGGVLLGLLVGLLSLISAVAIVQVLLLIIPALHRGPLLNPLNGSTTNAGLYAASFVAFIIAGSTALYNLFSRRMQWHNLTLGAWLWWAILMVLTSLYLPGASYLFSWPLLLGLIALGYGFVSRGRRPVLETLLIIVLPATAGLLLFTPTIYGIFVALTINLYAVVGLFVALVILLLLPHLRLMTADYRWTLPIASVVAGVSLLIFAALTSGA